MRHDVEVEVEDGEGARNVRNSSTKISREVDVIDAYLPYIKAIELAVEAAISILQVDGIIHSSENCHNT